MLAVVAMTVAVAGIVAMTAGSVVNEQADGRSPASWRTLGRAERARFDLGHAVFNTSWVPANAPAGRRDGLGPLFNSVSCDACHNSRRRGRGPVGDGPAPTDFVIQAGRRLDDGSVARGHPRFGRVVNTDAIDGFVPEAEVSIHYQAVTRTRPDGSALTLWRPDYRLRLPDDGTVPGDLVLMPRMAPSAQGVGLLEAIPEAAILAAASNSINGQPRGMPSWAADNDVKQLGRFGWQATEADVAGQIAVAFAREMGLTNPLIDRIDCAAADSACRDAAQGGSPEVSAELFDALLAFQRWEAPRRTPAAAEHLRANHDGAQLFADAGCGHCHRSEWTTRNGLRIAPYTDLLLHDLGPELADRDVDGRPVPSRWRTAPLWGLSTAHEGGRPVRLLHDGRARSLDEAIAWHGGAANAARARYEALSAADRQRLLDWLASL